MECLAQIEEKIPSRLKRWIESLTRAKGTDEGIALKKLKMKKLPAFTLGVEEEYQIIDPETRDCVRICRKLLMEPRLY
jgi:hypothetical protein